MRGVVATGKPVDEKALVEKARSIPTMEGSDLVRNVAGGRVRRPAEDPEELPSDRLTREAPAQDRGMTSMKGTSCAG